MLNLRSFTLNRVIGGIEWHKRPRFSRRAYLFSLGRVTVKAVARLVNAIENRPLPRHAILFGNVSAFPLALEFARRRLSCSFSIYSSTTGLIVRSFVRSSIRPPIYSLVRARSANSLVYIRSSRCALSYYFPPAIFARSVSTEFPLFLPLFIPADVYLTANPDSWPSRERAITILHSYA